MEKHINNLKINKVEENTNLQKKPILDGNLTGYPSIDKPWLKYYNEEAKNATVPKCTIYNYLIKTNKNNLNRVAINYYGNKIEYNQLFKKIDDVAKAYKKIGVKAGDVVTLCLPNVPETIYSLYALNKIGAVVSIIDPRTNAERIKYFCNISDSKVMITIDLCIPKIDKIINETNIEHSISVSVTDSFPLGLNIAYNLKNMNLKSLFSSKRFK